MINKCKRELKRKLLNISNTNESNLSLVSERKKIISEIKSEIKYLKPELASGKQTSNCRLFFCLTTSSGTEGIKDVKNSVAFLALYRGTFM